jgi:hypothetical protein
MRRILLVVAVLAGCGGADDDVAGDDGGVTPDSVEPAIAAAPSLLRVADPRLPGFDGWPLPFVREGGAGCRVSVGDLAIFDDCDPSWDGAGAPVGALTVEASVVDESGRALASTTVEIHVVHAGITSIQLASPERIPLFWPETMWEQDPTAAPWRVASYVESVEAPPPVWDDVARDPDDEATWNLPIAIVAGAALTPEVVVDGAFGAAEVRLVAPAVETPRAVERVDLGLDWRFEGRAPDGAWQPMPGAISTVHRIYALAGPPVLASDDVPHRAWVDVVDTATRWANGEALLPEEVAGALVEGVYYDLGLRYDNVEGASAYTWYAGDAFGEAQFDLSAFRTRQYGSTINCSDAASILETYAGMVGVDLRYHILLSEFGDGFDLNFIRAIGFDAFDETPFLGDRGAFRYHAVVGPASGTIFDATLALDGDGDATTAPHVVLLPVDLPQAQYLEALSSEYQDIVVQHDEKVRLH